MKGFLSQKQVEKIKEQYPVGTRIELIHMDDSYGPIKPGAQGTVDSVDDVGTLHMRWDNGRTLGIVPGEDQSLKKRSWKMIKNKLWEGWACKKDRIKTSK